MPLMVETAATNFNLIQVAVVRDMLPLPVDMRPSDATVGRYIAWASDAIVTYLGRDLARQQYTETLPGYGMTEVQLSRFPIEGTPPVTVDNQVADSVIVSDPAWGVIYWTGGFRWSPQIGVSVQLRRVPGTEEFNVSVGPFWAGYVLPGDINQSPSIDSRPLPALIERAAFITVKEWFLEDRRDPEQLQRSSSTGSKSRAADDPYTTITDVYAPRDPKDDTQYRMLPPAAMGLLAGFRTKVVLA